MNFEKPIYDISGFSVRDMCDEDINNVVKIEREVYPFPWSEKILSELFYFGLKNKENHSSVINDVDNKAGIYGYAFWQMIVDECYILNFAIAAEMQGKGLGSFFLEKILKQANQIGAQKATLEVRIGNKPAIALYEKFGFTVIAMRKNYYVDDGNKEDALVMWLQEI
ncbi:MAG: ribosomal protein S18-alanine N-acetyltransferase [Nitrospinota bacterium]|nr:ribosomal protein S18-alanine N-acetyltransferase [Nitrospinota bacterium]